MRCIFSWHLLLLFNTFCATMSKSLIKNLPDNWKEFIDPDILANSNEDFTRYDSDLPEGDILGLQTLQLSQGAANAINDASSFWPNNTIPYEFSKKQYALMTPKEMKIILESMQIITRLSGGCVKFVKRTAEEDYISFQKGLQCMSNIGRIGGKQAITYAPGCLKHHGDVQHELMHVMGFFHEHSRSDRDQHVLILWDNIAKSDRDQFAKHEEGNTYGLPYDYESVMHYKYNAFAKDSSIPTILPTVKKSRVGQNKNLSPLDIVRIYRRFHCQIADPSNSADESDEEDNGTKCPDLQSSKETTTEKVEDQCPLQCPETSTISQKITNEKADDQCPVCPLPCPDTGDDQEDVPLPEVFPQFSREPMSLDQCRLQFNANCDKPGLTIFNCTSALTLDINCNSAATSQDLQRMSTAMSKSPLRAIKLSAYDGEKLDVVNFASVRKQVVLFHLYNCISTRATHRLNTIIQTVEKATFTNLPDLKLLSMENGLSDVKTFSEGALAYLTRLHCGCEFQWFRNWWSGNQQLLRKANIGEVYRITDSWSNAAFNRAEIFLPIDCTSVSLITGSSSVDYSQHRFSTNVPDSSDIANKNNQCDDTTEFEADFADFSTEPMTTEECIEQYTAHCVPATLGLESCTSFRRFELSCVQEVSSQEVIDLVASIAKFPPRATLLKQYDGPHIAFSTFAPIRRQIAVFYLSRCMTSRPTGKLHELRLPNLLDLGITSCRGLTIYKNDFEHSIKLRILVFLNVTINSLEKDTFTNLPDLRFLSLENGLKDLCMCNQAVKDYLFNLHCGCQFASFRRWRQGNLRLLREAETGQIYSVAGGWLNGAYKYRDGESYLPIDCSADPFPFEDEFADFSQTAFSLNEPSC
ncbi:uncharacterized protein LOC129594844 isoform X2 [Paramacrobiotus metropolitanus]|uniref:uncharacterized protein LOC129594844 isoform X2 n=1 Tax=Paramacrobiotus metropolitanus TaxID=2943436 RepID=UPI00244612AE|nr:uncharacterized protein LOC129594844 isoform X2 [Paramacrobiotus metropolitanus]